MSNSAKRSDERQRIERIQARRRSVEILTHASAVFLTREERAFLRARQCGQSGEGMLASGC